MTAIAIIVGAGLIAWAIRIASREICATLAQEPTDG